MVKVKICGVTNVRDARAAARLGADALGFNFWPASPRYIEPARARAIVAALPPFVTAVGVFVNEPAAKVLEICRQVGLSAVQLHGDERPAMVASLHGLVRIKAFPIRDEQDLRRLARYSVEAYLLDAYAQGSPGGTGKTFNWDIARQAQAAGPVILAGGLTPGNVAEAVAAAKPYAVDVASGVESEPGVKDRDLMAAFILNAKAAE
jgi:phosphoribosylanthranilate isomerase